MSGLFSLWLLVFPAVSGAGFLLWRGSCDGPVVGWPLPWFLRHLYPPQHPHIFQAGQVVGWRFCAGLVSQSIHWKCCLVTAEGQLRLWIPHCWEPLLGSPSDSWECSFALGSYLARKRSPIHCFSQYALPPCPSLLPPVHGNIYSVSPSREIHMFPPLSPPSYLATLDLWIVEWLFFTTNIHL